MNTKSLIAIALAALLVFAGGAAALPSQAAGADAADDHQPDDPGANASDENDDDDGNVTDADDARDENASEGPPTDMPGQVPDHVSQIHELVRDKLDGNLTGQELGEAISDVLGNGEDAQADSADEESEDANETATESSEQSEDANETATETSEETETADQSTTTNASVAGDLPEQAADHVSAIHDAIQSFLDGDGDGTPGDDVSSTAG